MDDERRTAVRSEYAVVTGDLDRLWDLCSEDIVFHISGTHPLSGSYFGRSAVETYLRAVRRVPGDGAGFTVTSVLADPKKDLLLVEGTARTGSPAFVRTVVHVLRFRDGLLAEFWDYPFDQQAEDAFWRSAAARGIPRQREAVAAVGTPPLNRL